MPMKCVQGYNVFIYNIFNSVNLKYKLLDFVVFLIGLSTKTCIPALTLVTCICGFIATRAL